MLGLPTERQPQRPTLYIFAGYLKHLSSQFWISSSGIGESPQTFFSPNQQIQMLEWNNQWEQARMSTDPAAGGSAEMRFSAFGMAAMSKVPLSVLCGDLGNAKIAV